MGHVATRHEAPKIDVRVQAALPQHFFRVGRRKAGVCREVACGEAHPIGEPIPPVRAVEGEHDEPAGGAKDTAHLLKGAPGI